MIITESEMTKEDCDRINKELTRVRKEQGIKLFDWGDLDPEHKLFAATSTATENATP